MYILYIENLWNFINGRLLTTTNCLPITVEYVIIFEIFRFMIVRYN